MIISVIFVLLFLAFLMGIILVPKIDGKINMIKVAVMGIMANFLLSVVLGVHVSTGGNTGES